MSADPLDTYAERANESIRALSHAVREHGAIIPPRMYRLLGSLQDVGYVLAHLLGQLAAQVEASARAVDLYEDDGGDPASSLATAAEHLRAGSQAATVVGREADGARQAIAHIGHQTDASC